MQNRKQTSDNTSQPDPENNLGRGAPGDREERIRQRAYELWELDGRQEGDPDAFWHRATTDLDREDGAIQNDRIADDRDAGN